MRDKFYSFQNEKLIYIAVTLFMTIALLHFLIKKQQNEGYMLFLFLISGYVLLRLFQVDMVYYKCNYAGIVYFAELWCLYELCVLSKIFFRK